MRSTVLFLTLLSAAACDPAAGIRIGTRLAPSPDPLCIDSAVTQSTLLVRVDTLERPDQRSSRSVFLYNVYFEPQEQPSVAGVYLDPTTADSTEVGVFFRWLGRLGKYSDSTRDAAASRGIALLREVQDACVPPPNTPITCEQFQSLRKTTPCNIGPG